MRLFAGPNPTDAHLDAYAKCRFKILDETVSTYEKRLRDNPFALSIAGSAEYDNDGSFAGANGTGALDGQFHTDALGGSDVKAGLNATYEDALPSDGDDDPAPEREQKIGGGFELTLEKGLGGEDDNARALEVGFGSLFLACTGGGCKQNADNTTVRLNPFLGVGLTKSIGARIDLVWEGAGSDFDDAIAGISFKYAFREE
jgi:hypothetical protein